MRNKKKKYKKIPKKNSRNDVEILFLCFKRKRN